MTPPVVSATGLRRDYTVGGGAFRAKRTLHALREATFSIDAGRTLAVVGESGCGKSTLARLVTMIEEPTAGTLSIDGNPVVRSDWPRHRASVQIVFQNPYGSLNLRHRVETVLEEPLRINHPNMPAAERRRRGLEMMSLVGLRPEQYERYPHMFSGGQRQRIAIARALMLNPRLVVLDEPVSALDLSIQGQILNLLMDLQERFGLAYFFISHDLSVVRLVADRVMVMYLGRAVETGPTQRVFAAPRHPYTKALLSATPVADPERAKRRVPLRGELPSPLAAPPGCPFAPRCPKAASRCREERPTLDSSAHSVACHYPEQDGSGRRPDSSASSSDPS